MSDTSIQTSPVAVAAPIGGSPPAEKPRRKWTLVRVLKLVASLELTVILFTLSLLLVFFGTLAQIDSGIWTVVGRYFRSAYVWVPWQLLVKFGQKFCGVPESATVSGSFPFPGGGLLGTALLVNLVAAHLVRFKLSWKRAGILAIHAGLIILMLGELGTRLFSVEQRMTIATGEKVNFTDTTNHVELAFTTRDPSDELKDLVVVVPQRLLLQKERVTDDSLPVDLQVSEFWKNSSDLIQVTDNHTNVTHRRRALNGVMVGLVEEDEAAGVDPDAKEDTPAAEVVLYRKGTEVELGRFFVALRYYPNQSFRIFEFAPETFKAGGKTYEIELRPKREYKPYALTLKEFRFDKYEGTEIAKNFSSLVDLETASGERREYKISMNHPLFHNGETFYQSQFLPGHDGTILQVVRNPVWWMPYLSCAAVTLGMLVHFGINLLGFLQRRVVS